MGRKWLSGTGAALLIGLAGTWLASGEAQAADPVAEQVVITADLAASGELKVSQEITFDQLPGEVEQRLVTRQMVRNDAYQEYEYSQIKASSDGRTLETKISTDNDYTRVKVPTGDAATRTVTISYQVKGAVGADPQGNPVFRWDLVQGLPFQIRQVKGQLSGPAMISSIDCVSGPAGSVTKCSTFAGGTHDAPQPAFTDGPRGAGERIRLEIGFLAGDVSVNTSLHTIWTLDRAFTANWATLSISLAVILLGGLALFLLHRMKGSDARGQEPIQIAGFEPVGEGQSVFRSQSSTRPGQIGTLADERVDPIDITATILDLAVRGHLRIHELADPGMGPDWSFERLDSDEDELVPYERRILESIAPADGSVIRVSGCATPLRSAVAEVQRDLYDDVVAQGWFDHRPDQTRGLWSRIGLGAVIVSGVTAAILVSFTSYGIVGLSLIGVALGLIWVAERMPRRTPAGVAALQGVGVLAGVLATHPTSQIPKGQEYTEISRILPYAVVLGGRDRWLEALAAADDDPGVADPTDLTWYHAPADWHLAQLPGSLRAFITTLQGELFSR